MKGDFSKEELYLLILLKNALAGIKNPEDNYSEINIDIVIAEAQKHAVLSLLYDELESEILTDIQRKQVDKYCRQIVLQNYRLLFLTKYLVGVLQENRVSALVLKGVSTASWYPIPELRKSGDVDLLISKSEQVNKVTNILEEAGFTKKSEQHANYHMEFLSPDGIAIEIHTDFTEQFANKQLNISMQNQVEKGLELKVMGETMGMELPMLNKAFHAYELLLHMLHHFTTSGFGLKLLCDWVVCWNQEWLEAEKQEFHQLTIESKTEKFAEAVTETCSVYLGLTHEKFAWNYENQKIPYEALMREILDAEEFGESNKNRMVMMEGTGCLAYVREFHHQMHINFPKAGRVILLWPLLWCITLVRFLRNNKKVRNTSAKEILKEAKRRSALMEQLKVMR